MDIKQYFKDKADIINKELDRLMPAESDYPEILNRAMRYSVFAGGKRLRPILMLAACEAFGSKTEDALPYACAIEMIHTYSLIHDDLPAMDNDDLRRGMPTNHKVFGEDMAILAGDGLLSLAFQVMAADIVNRDETRFLKALKAIADAAGVKGMVAGQAVDITSEGTDISPKVLEYIHLNKTSAMIKGALKAGAFIGGASDEQAEILAEAGDKIGLAFQIQDDILDIESTPEVLGKNTNSDIKNDKKTYVSMYGIEYSKDKVKEYSMEAANIISGLNADIEVLRETVKYLTVRTY